jgi:hypothetical protein
MRLLLAAATWLVLAAATTALAQNAPQRIDDPRVNGQPIDHCADVEGGNDCSVRGQAKAASKACVANSFADQTGFHWQAASGTAMHYITEYDMHAGEVGGRWVQQPTSGTFVWIECKK